MNSNDRNLNELMSKGWSWSSCSCDSPSSDSTSSVTYVTDITTHKKYKLYVDNGKLVMSEVTN